MHKPATLEFQSSLKTSAIEASVVAMLLVITLSLLAHFWIGVRPAWLAIGASVIVGVVAFGYYFGRSLKATKTIRLTEDQLMIEGRTRETVFWREVRQAFHESDAGLRWRLEVPNASIVIRDDGFSTTQWDELSAAMTVRLARHGVVVETSGWAEAFETKPKDEWSA